METDTVTLTVTDYVLLRDLAIARINDLNGEGLQSTIRNRALAIMRIDDDLRADMPSLPPRKAI